MIIEKNFDKVLDLPTEKRHMQQFGEFARGAIIVDADSGKFQNGKSGFQYSPKYKLLKANDMRDDKGKRLPGYEGARINTETSYVNMRLTGETFARIQVKSKDYETSLVYPDAEIVEKNAKRGYDIFDISNKNLDAIADKVLALIK